MSDLGQNEEAIFCFDKVISMNDADETVWNNKGIALYHLGRFLEAADCFERAVSVGNDALFSWCNKGEALVHLDKENEATMCFNHCIRNAVIALETSDFDEGAWRMRGHALHFCGHLDEAIVYFDSAIKISESICTSWRYKADCLRDMGRMEEAISLYDISLSLDSHSFESWIGKSLTLFRLSRIDESIKCIQEAIKMNPNALALMSRSNLEVDSSEESLRIPSPVSSTVELNEKKR